MEGLAVALATAAGVIGGWCSGIVADRVGERRYAPEAAGHDPDDAALAPLEPPTTARQRVALAVMGGAGLAVLALGLDDARKVAYFGVLLVGYLAAMTVDLQYLRLPNVFTFPAMVFAVGGAAAISARDHLSMSGAWVGMAAYAGFLWLARVAYLLARGREGMGMGDVKLALSLGASVGWLGSIGFEPTWAGALRLVVYAALLGNLLGAVGGLVALRGIDREFPFGPSLVVGWIVVVALADTLTA